MNDKEYKLNSNSLKNIINEEAILHDNYYEKSDSGVYKEEPTTHRSSIVIIKSAELDADHGFMIVSFSEPNSDKIRTLRLRRNGLSINFNNKGKYEHYFTYKQIRYVKVRMTTTGKEGSEVVEDFLIPNSFVSALVPKLGKLVKEVSQIWISNTSYDSPQSANSDDNVKYTVIFKFNK